METVCIIGLGYVGLPLACLCASKGLKVKGLELDKEKLALIKDGKSPIKDEFLEAGMQSQISKIEASVNAKHALHGSDVIIVCVPTPAKQEKPDLHHLESACEAISGNLEKGMLVIIESTVYPGTTEEIVQPILEKSGLKAGKDFFLGHCPERIDPGNRRFTIANTPRVLGALSKEGLEKAAAFYKKILDADVLELGSVKAAEATKVVENTFRDINIAFVNELAKSFDKMGIDLSEVIKGASTKPFGFMPFYPGPGVGGHCIGVDPYYLIARAEQSGFKHRFLMLAREINKGMPGYVVSLVKEALEKEKLPFPDAKISVLGIAYKADVDDTRESPALEIASMLAGENPNVKIFDPFVLGKSNVQSLDMALQCDCVVLATAHKQFLEKLQPRFLKEKGVKIVIDARNCLDRHAIESIGIVYKGIGR